MESDLELLELAAKAVGHKIDQRLSFMTWRDCRRFALLNPQGGHALWSPLEDDEDALRLAVKLGIDLVHFNGHLRADVRGMPDVHQLHDSDPYAATRRAIVRAAAEIGKTLG